MSGKGDVFNLKSYLCEKKALVDRAVMDMLDREPSHPLEEIYRYCLESGKRFRPILVMAAAQACGMAGQKVIPAALALELIHNFSLIHDDLPCMDDDEERRGRPTCHVKFGVDMALLAGDGLLIHAFEVLSRNAQVSGIPADRVLQVVSLFSRSAGHRGMTGGQVLDVAAQKSSEVDREILHLIHEKKTGALLKAALLSGGILSGAGESSLEALSIYGHNVGLTYQIIDDLLDWPGDAQAVSFPGVFGVAGSRRMARDATEKAVAALELFGFEALPLRELAVYLLNRKK